MPDISAQELKTLIDQTYKIENEYKGLRASYSHLQDTIEKVIEFLPNAIWILDDDGKVFLQNSAASELYELLIILKLDEDDYELSFSSRSYLIKSSTYQDKRMISATDITDQKRKENLATMGQMAAHLSHEIRNPIGSISLLASTLKKRVADKNIPIVEEIESSIYRIDRIIKATLMFSKGVVATKSPMRFSSVINEIKSAVGYYSYSKDITFDFDEIDFIFEADKDLLVMLFTNFIFNAIDAIELDENDDGVIEFKYVPDETYHILEIYDTGVPIENPQELFEAFKSTKEKGNGLGLILSKQIAQSHNGEISLIDSKKKGFRITLLK